jgi:hypothetical protein
MGRGILVAGKLRERQAGEWSILPLLGCNLLEREMGNIRPIPGMFNGHGADVSILVAIELRLLIEILGLCHFCRSEFYVERVGVLKILDGHGLRP